MKKPIIAALILLTGCGEASKNETGGSGSVELDSNLLIGCWYLDSSTNHNLYNDQLYINENFEYFIFSGSNGGGLSENGQIPFKDSLQNQYGTMNKIELLDSFTLKKNWSGWVTHEDFYRKLSYSNVDEELDLALKNR